MSATPAPIDETRSEIQILETEREKLFLRLKEIEYELSYRKNLVSVWDMVLQSDLLKQNLLKQIQADNLSPQ